MRAKGGHSVIIKSDIGKLTPDLRRLICDAVSATLDYQEYEKKAEVSVLLCDNERIKELNSEYRGIDRATDVLSFPLFDDEETDGLTALGDIVISVERARSQAAEYGHSTEREIAFLTVHSMLHLLGYDHETSKEDEEEMFSLQKSILCKMGIER